jgi:hypothetical protein
MAYGSAAIGTVETLPLFELDGGELHRLPELVRVGAPIPSVRSFRTTPAFLNPRLEWYRFFELQEIGRSSAASPIERC